MGDQQVTKSDKIGMQNRTPVLVNTLTNTLQIQEIQRNEEFCMPVCLLTVSVFLSDESGLSLTK